ncbi:MAG: plasmid replication protein, CyRepA1 family [Methylococcaceae bacterium]
MKPSTSILAQGFNSDKELNTDSNPRIIDCHLEHLNSEQVTAFIVSIAENDKKTAIVDSGAMASGKTKLAATIAKQLNYESFVAIAHRISLIHGLSKNLNLTNYNDATPHEYLRNLAVCVNSIQKFNVSKRFKNGVVDEFRQTLETILMSNLIENKKEILAEFDALLNNTDFLMCLDADFNEFCLDYLLEHTDKTIYRIHRHIEPHYKQIIERKNHNFIRKECVQNYFNGLNSMVAVSTIAEARKNILYWRECGIKESEILDITGDNRKDDRVKAFYLNPDEEIKQYRFLIYTPSITSGTSIVEPHFDRHYAMFHKVLQSNENLQMIARDRTAQTVYCSFAKDDGKKLPTNLEQLVNGSIKQRQRLKLTKDNILQTSDVKLEPIEVLQLKLQVQFNENLNDYRTNFFNHALNSGYSVKSYDPNRIDEIDDVLQKGLNKRALEHRINTIFNSPIVDDIQAQIINKAGETTQEETNSLHRYKTTQMAGTSNIG